MILDHVVSFGSEAQGRLVDDCHHELSRGLVRGVRLKAVPRKERIKIQWNAEIRASKIGKAPKFEQMVVRISALSVFGSSGFNEQAKSVPNLNVQISDRVSWVWVFQGPIVGNTDANLDLL